jgi:hypothetical protein
LTKEYTGPLPDGAVLRGGPYGTFGDTPYAQFGISSKGMYVDDASGATYFFTDTDLSVIWKTDDGFKTRVPVSAVGSYYFLIGWRNP